VLENFDVALKALAEHGVEVRDVELPNLSYALACYYILMPAEVSSNLARFDGMRFGAFKEGKNLGEDYALTRGELFGVEARRRIILGTYVLSHGYYDAYYRKALAVRKIIAEDFARIFDSGVSAVATPTTPTPAFKLGEKSGDPLQMYAADIFTVPANIAGIPGLTVPSGTVEREGTNLPVGIQLMARKCGEETLFSLGKFVKKNHGN
jgi:aspartyl-tRNA(Asn)/glutamyl-tRNA(Gln) amidotransferase subunit A